MRRSPMRIIRGLRREFTADLIKKHATHFNHYTVREFQREMQQLGMDVMEIRMQPLTHHAYFFLRKFRS